MQLQGKKAIVTGSSKGIGKALVEILVANGVKTVGWSRSKNSFSHPDFLALPVDIADENAVEDAFTKSVSFLNNEVDILINNAGFGLFNKMEEQNSSEWQNMFAVNVHGLFYTSKRIIPLMKKKQSGHIINIASIAALQGINEATAYCGTKFAVRGISQAMYQEVKPFKIKVTCVMPGSVNTEFFNNINQITANASMLLPADIAQQIIYILESPDNFVTSEIEIRPISPVYS